jgi:AcrR family transcriptional regulator
MSAPVKRRHYDSSRRRAAAEATRRNVLAAARDLFIERGYAGTPVAEIARRAEVSVDTVYASVGRKPQLLLAVHDMELAGTGLPVPAEERGYVRRIQAAPRAREKLEIYSAALADALPRTVPLLQALRTAADDDPACGEVFESVSQRRARHMLRLAADLRATGDLRDDVDDQWVADLLWSLTGPEYYQTLTGHGRSPDQYARMVLEVWSRSLLS